MNDRVETIKQMITDGSSAKDIAEATGCHIMNVYGIAKRYGLKIKPKALKCEQYHEQMVVMVNEGMSASDIGVNLGLTEEQVKGYRKQLGIKAANPNRMKHTENEAAEQIAKAAPTIEYVGGYVNRDSRVVVRCKACGAEFERSYHSITTKGKNVRCPECLRKKHEAQARAEAKAKQQREVNRQKRKRQAVAQMVDVGQISLSVCPVCGNLALYRKYCSRKCQRKAENKRNELKRDRKVRAAMVDKDITVQGLFKRDGGICQLCGKPCRLDDYVVVNGQKQCGNWYPSIDHIKPLSKGGLHAWDNVQLAHRICNSRKSDNG